MTMTAITLVWKTIHNATRWFKKHLWVWQAKAMRRLMIWIIVNGTTILQRLYKESDEIQAHKFREWLSNHLWNVDLQPIIDEKAKKLINKSKKYKDWNILAWDASDIFKPHAQCMQWLKTVRDWSTGLYWNGYVIYGININGITHQLSLKDPEVEYIGAEKREIMLKKSARIIDPKETIWVFDRWHDDVWFIDILWELNYNYVVRAKKSRVITNLETWEKVKVKYLKEWRYKVELEWWTESYLYVVKWFWKEPIRLYSNIEFEQNEECLEIYLRRWKIEEDYKKLKSFWLEKVRLMSFKKVVNIMLIIQFIVMLWQDLYNEVASRVKTIPSKLYLYYKRFCKQRSLTENPSSFLTFVSKNIWDFIARNTIWIPHFTLFWDRRRMRKVGLI